MIRNGRGEEKWRDNEGGNGGNGGERQRNTYFYTKIQALLRKNSATSSKIQVI